MSTITYELEKQDPSATNGIAADVVAANLHFYERYPNRWCYIRERYLKDAASEFFGTMLLLIVGAGVDCQVMLSESSAIATGQRGTYLSATLGWAAGAAVGVWVASGSGGHINPAVTLTMAVFRGFSWKKVPIYVLSQTLGAWAGAMITYLVYYTAIGIVDPLKTTATASLFSTYGLDYVPSGICWFNEFVGTAMLLMIVFAVTDRSNGPPPAGLVPLVIFFALLAIGASIGMQTGYALNPARDFGPRIALWMVGYGGETLFRFRSLYWLWCPIIAPIVGALVGATLYDAFLFVGPESPFNRPSKEALRYFETSGTPAISVDMV